MSVAAKKLLTYTDYAALPEGSPYQLIGGELALNPAPTPYHQRISRNLEFELFQFVKKQDLGEVFYAPIDVFFSDTEVYQPDIIFISKDRLHIIGEKKIEEAPDLIVEILSPSTGYYDLRHKKNVYEAAGVREYWLVDPQEKLVEIFALRDGVFREAGSARDKDDSIASSLLPGFRVSLAAIF